LLVTVGGISWEAVNRFGSNSPINAQGVMGVAALGVLVNGISALMLARGQHADANMRAAFLHMVSDAAISLGVVVAGWLVLRTGILWIDSAACLVIAVLIGLGAWSVLREAVDLALDAVPGHVDPSAVRAYLSELPGVLELHDLHIWSMSTTEHALTAHLVIHWAAAPPAFMVELDAELEKRFGIQHATVQLEPAEGSAACRGTVPGAL
jgi:cobalt-zinc-cadmium efflux system protein